MACCFASLRVWKYLSIILRLGCPAKLMMVASEASLSAIVLKGLQPHSYVKRPRDQGCGSKASPQKDKAIGEILYISGRAVVNQAGTWEEAWWTDQRA
jgi:hypothetical protein